MRAGGHFGGRTADGSRQRRIEQPERGVGLRGCLFDQCQGTDETARQTLPADREVLHRALRLCAPEGIGRHFKLAHAVAFDAKR